MSTIYSTRRIIGCLSWLLQETRTSLTTAEAIVRLIVRWLVKLPQRLWNGDAREVTLAPRGVRARKTCIVVITCKVTVSPGIEERVTVIAGSAHALIEDGDLAGLPWGR